MSSIQIQEDKDREVSVQTQSITARSSVRNGIKRNLEVERTQTHLWLSKSQPISHIQYNCDLSPSQVGFLDSSTTTLGHTIKGIESNLRLTHCTTVILLYVEFPTTTYSVLTQYLSNLGPNSPLKQEEVGVVGLWPPNKVGEPLVITHP